MPMPPTSEIVVALLMSTAAGLVGSIAVMRRMALASDALSHVALPGIALAMLFHFSPLLGGFAALMAGTLIVWALEYRTRIPTEAVIGVLSPLPWQSGVFLPQAKISSKRCSVFREGWDHWILCSGSLPRRW
jgi:ABC-type Mn2+/Zn2+ transport system permease subunit